MKHEDKKKREAFEHMKKIAEKQDQENELKRIESIN
jgi:hypothetical protein